MKQSGSVAALGVVCMLLGCQQAQLPELPEVDLATMAPAVASQVGEARERAIQSPMSGDAVGELAMVLHAYRLLNEAAAAYERARALEPKRFRWVYLHGRTLGLLGEEQAAQQALAAALQLRPGYPPALLALARSYARTGQDAESMELLQQLLDGNPRFAEAQVAAAQFYLANGQPTAAIEHAQAALAIHNRFGKAHMVLAQAYLKNGEEALSQTHARLFERYRRIAPIARDPVMDEVDRLDHSDATLLQRALDHVAEARHQQAIEAFESMLEQHPEAAAPHINLVAVYGQLRQFERAQFHADRAMKLDPDSIELYDNLGVLRLLQGRGDEAILFFRRASELDPGYARPLKNLGATYNSMNQPEQALRYLQQAVALEPTDTQARFLLGKTLLETGDASQAITVLQPLVRVDTASTALYLHSLGKAQLASGLADDAETTLTEAQRQANLYGLEGLSSEISDDLVAARSAP